MVEVFKGTPIRRMTTGGNYVNLTADVVLLSDYEALRAELEQVKRERDGFRDIAARKSNQVAALIKAEAAERLAGARVVTLPDDDDKLAQMVEDFHRGSVAFANDPDEFSHLIEFTPARLRSFISALAEPAGEAEAWQFDRYVNGVLMAEGVTIERQTTKEGAFREAARIASKGPNGEAPVLVLTTPPASAIREALERFDGVDPSESIGCYGGSGQWIELGTVADLRALAGAKP